MGGGSSKSSAVTPAPAHIGRAKSLKGAIMAIQSTERMKVSVGIKQSTQAYVRGSLRDDAPVPGAEYQPAVPDPVVPIRGFGKYRFKGSTARPYLLANGLQGNALDDGEWTKGDADAVANAVTQWAGELGALHVCHWTQPIRSANSTWRASEPTRMVHALFNPDVDGNAVSTLDGEYLVFGEGDSRKMIDVTSPMWVLGDTLYIPALFAQYANSWGGADPVMDEKTPLLRSMAAVSRAGARLLSLLGHECTAVMPQIGLEQEFFLVTREAYERRPDLRMCGRTLLGAEPDGGDLYDTHSTPLNPAARAAMAEVQDECYKLGIALRTRHRESAPNQYEYAPYFGLATAQIDENLVVMEIIEEVARKYGLAALMHEKPFTGVAGSGKHNNFSLSTEAGFNLFNEKHVNAVDSKGKAGGSYDVFPTILAAVCRAVHLHGDLMLTSVACPGNDFRLTKGGAAEAPPLTISVHMGDSLTAHLTEFAGTGAPPFNSPMAPFQVRRDKLLLGIDSVDQLGGIEVSSEPRNRTAPFPYGGRRFELRAPGSSQNTSFVNVVLCSAIAESFDFFSGQMAAGRSAREVAAASLVEHGLAAIFNGNNYSAAWKAEADGRGIFSADSVTHAISRLQTKKAASLFGPLGVYTSEDLHTRAAIAYENYVITITVEARCLCDLVTMHLLPVAKSAPSGSTELCVLLEAAVAKMQAAMAAVDDMETDSGGG